MAHTPSYINVTINTTSTTEGTMIPIGPIDYGRYTYNFSYPRIVHEPFIEYVMPENVRDKIAGQALKHDKTIDLTIIGAGGIL